MKVNTTDMLHGYLIIYKFIIDSSKGNVNFSNFGLLGNHKSYKWPSEVKYEEIKFAGKLHTNGYQWYLQWHSLMVLYYYYSLFFFFVFFFVYKNNISHLLCIKMHFDITDSCVKLTQFLKKKRCLIHNFFLGNRFTVAYATLQ